METSQKASGQEEIVSDDDFSSVDKSGDTVSRSAYQRALDQRKKDLQAKRALEEKLSFLESQQREAEEAELRRKGELEKILQERDKRITELETQKENFQKSLEVEIKRQAFLEALPGKLIDRDYEKHIPLDQITFTEDGDLDMNKVGKLAEAWSKRHYRLIDSGKGGAKLPGDAPEASKGLTYQEWLKLPTKEKKARIKEVIN